jgi:hypothetical protein
MFPVSQSPVKYTNPLGAIGVDAACGPAVRCAAATFAWPAWVDAEPTHTDAPSVKNASPRTRIVDFGRALTAAS